MIHKIFLKNVKKKKKETRIGKRVRKAQKTGKACALCWGAQICVAQGWKSNMGEEEMF